MLNDSLISKTNSSDNSPHWEWTPCHFDLKRESKKKIEYLNIGSQASFFLENQVFIKNVSI